MTVLTNRIVREYSFSKYVEDVEYNYYLIHITSTESYKLQCVAVNYNDIVDIYTLDVKTELVEDISVMSNTILVEGKNLDEVETKRDYIFSLMTELRSKAKELLNS